MPIIPIDSLDDPRVRFYRNLRDRDLAREGNRFLAEGEFVVRRLIDSVFPCESVLVESQRAAELAEAAGPDVPVYSVASELLDGVVGFPFHRGALAIGMRREQPSLDDLIAGRLPGQAEDVAAPNDLSGYLPPVLLVLPQILNSENLGALLRTASAFGVRGVLLGPKCSDPFWRRTSRVSMGCVFAMPIRMSGDLVADLQTLHSEHGYELVATTLDADAKPIDQQCRPRRMALLVGAEDTGLPPHIVRLCQHNVTIPMELGTDSLNVNIATAVFLYHYTRVASLNDAG